MRADAAQPATRWTAARIAVLFVLLWTSIGSLAAGALVGLAIGLFNLVGWL